jgi:hypothetical protein
VSEGEKCEEVCVLTQSCREIKRLKSLIKNALWRSVELRLMCRTLIELSPTFETIARIKLDDPSDRPSFHLISEISAPLDRVKSIFDPINSPVEKETRRSLVKMFALAFHSRAESSAMNIDCCPEGSIKTTFTTITR